ncbi:MAG: histidine phosphatase family protein [Kofleriaceae bacterium]
MPSDVFLIRHAAAVGASQDLRDGHRHLSMHGREQARALGDRLRWHDCEPTHIWTSPLVRAVQTAELVAIGLHATCAIETMPGLAPDESPQAILAALEQLPHDALIMVFGHQPTISRIGGLLTRNDNFAAIGNAEAVRIHRDRVRWRFAWDAEAPTPNG